MNTPELRACGGQFHRMCHSISDEYSPNLSESAW